MKKDLLIRIGLCVLVFGFLLFSYIEKQNRLTRLRMEVPELVKEIGQIQEEIARLHYEIDRFESPTHLMELARSYEFSHLKHPFMDDVLSVSEGYAVRARDPKREEIKFFSPISLAIGMASK